MFYHLWSKSFWIWYVYYLAWHNFFLLKFLYLVLYERLFKIFWTHFSVNFITKLFRKIIWKNKFEWSWKNVTKNITEKVSQVSNEYFTPTKKCLFDTWLTRCQKTWKNFAKLFKPFTIKNLNLDFQVWRVQCRRIHAMDITHSQMVAQHSHPSTHFWIQNGMSQHSIQRYQIMSQLWLENQLIWAAASEI